MSVTLHLTCNQVCSKIIYISTVFTSMWLCLYIWLYHWTITINKIFILMLLGMCRILTPLSNRWNSFISLKNKICPMSQGVRQNSMHVACSSDNLWSDMRLLSCGQDAVSCLHWCSLVIDLSDLRTDSYCVCPRSKYTEDTQWQTVKPVVSDNTNTFLNQDNVIYKFFF